MAGTYGGQGQNEFGYGTNPDGTTKTRNFSIVYNKDTNVSQVYVNTGKNFLGVSQFDPVGTINWNTGKRTLIPSTALSLYEKEQFQSNPTFQNRTVIVIRKVAPSANAAQLLEPRGTAPPPAAPGTPAAPTNTPGAADAGPNADPDPDLSSFKTALTNLQKGQDPGSYGTWYYPENIASRGQDRVFIQMLKYVLPDISQSGSAFAGALSNRENDFATKSQILGSVTLPITNNLTESVEVDWGSDKLSSIAAGLMAGGIDVVNKAAGGDVFGALGGAVGTVAGGLENQGIAGRAKQYLAAKAAAGLVSGAGFQINPEAYLTRRTGTIPNPNLELLFNGPKLKAFGLVFKLTPRSEKEAHQIRNIIKFFKKGMAPIRGNNQENSFFLGTPNVFNIQFKSSDSSSELLSLPQFKTCALVTCGVNYTPDGIYAAYQDSKVTSQPISVTLQLGFSELTPVYNSDYDFPGDDNESVGPDRERFKRTIDNTSPPPSTPPATTPGGVPGNPLLTPRPDGLAPVLGGKGTAERAGQPGAYREYREGQQAGTIPLNVPFQAWKRQKGYP